MEQMHSEVALIIIKSLRANPRGVRVSHARYRQIMSSDLSLSLLGVHNLPLEWITTELCVTASHGIRITKFQLRTTSETAQYTTRKHHGR